MAFKPGGYRSLFADKGFTALTGDLSVQNASFQAIEAILSTEYPGYAPQTYYAATARVYEAIQNARRLTLEGPGGTLEAGDVPVNPAIPQNYRVTLVATVRGTDGVDRDKYFTVDTDTLPTYNSLQSQVSEYLTDSPTVGASTGGTPWRLDILYVWSKK